MSREYPSKNVLYVDVNNNLGIVPDGTKENPYRSIQEAMDLIVARLDAAIDNQYSVVVAPGIYVENVLIRSPYTHLVGLGKNAVRIQPAVSPSVAVVDATTASWDAYIAAGGATQAQADAQIGLLVADADLAFPNGVTFPTGVTIDNITMTEASPDANEFCCMMISAQNGVDGLSAAVNERRVTNCFLDEGIYMRNGVTFRVTECTISGHAYSRNTRVMRYDKVTVVDRYHDHDAAEPAPAAPFNTLSQIITVRMDAADLYYDGATLGSDRYCFQSSDITILGNASVTFTEINFIGMDQQASTSVTIDGGHMRGNYAINAPVAINTTLNGVHIEGNITIAAGGAKTVVMNGGRYMGSLTDPDVVFVGNVGNNS